MQYPPPAVLRSAGLGHTLSGAVADQLLGSRILVLGGEVDDEAANRLTARLLLLTAEDADADITLYISSPNGVGSSNDSLTAAMAIHDTMRHVEPDVATWGLGSVVGVGQFLLSSGARGKRRALPSTRVLMRQPTARIEGSATDITAQAELLTRWRRQIAELTAAHTGHTVERVLADSERDHWFTAPEALEYGLVDEIVTPARPE
jgi:ATP-dependent Clp protease protease subunit